MIKKREKRQLDFQTDSQIVYHGIQELIDGEKSLAGYNLEIVRKFSKHFNKELVGMQADEIFVDFGAGIGTLAEIWRDKFGIVPVLIEIDPTQVEILREKNFMVFPSFQSLNANLKYLYTSNVLEHIENDLQILKEIHMHMLPGGKIGIYVPALPFLFSDLDRKVGHYRRYKKRELISKVELAGFEVLECTYNDSIGVFASLALKIFGFKKNEDGLGSKSSLMFYDKYIYPTSKVLDKMGFRFIGGKNLFLIAIKRN